MVMVTLKEIAITLPNHYCTLQEFLLAPAIRFYNELCCAVTPVTASGNEICYPLLQRYEDYSIDFVNCNSDIS